MRRSNRLQLVVALAFALPAAAWARNHFSLGFGNATVSGFPSGVVFLSGGGSYDPATASNTPDVETTVHSNGGFRCVESVRQGPLAGCLAGEGVRWDTNQLRESTTFKCTGAANEPLKTAETSEDTAVLMSDFYRAGDGNDESFKALVILSKHDLDPEIPGVQNVWIQGVGCGTASGGP